jgi:queuine tRNA-ribosyltransferase
MFTLQKTHASGARRGTLHTAHGAIETPFFMPIATKGAVKTLSATELWNLEQHVDATTTPVVLSNTYHQFLRPGVDVLRHFKGLHAFMGWKGTMLTDSGGFQVFSLSHLRKLTDNGVEFQSHIDGKRHVFTPEFSMEVQSIIGADIWMAFDYFPGYPATREEVEHSVALTTDWAKRCKEWVDAYHTTTEQSQQREKPHQLFAIVQGSTCTDLREQSAKELVQLECDGYAVGGLAVGEPAEEMYTAIEAVTPHLPTDKPRYLMGVGMPEQILEAVKRGIDMFDCVLPTRNARHGTVFLHQDDQIVAGDLSQVRYSKLNIRGEVMRLDTQPLDPYCHCSTCTGGLSRAYIRHLYTVDEPLAARLTSVHNITFYLQLMKEIRTAIQSQ